MNKIAKFLDGQSLVEVIIALGVVVVLAISLVSTSLITQRTSRSAKNNTQATKLAQETVEKLRVLRDRQGFTALADHSCATLNSTAIDPEDWTLETAACPSGELIPLGETNFRRKFSIGADPADPSNADKRQITVEVIWNESGGTQMIKNVTNLSNCVATSITC